MAGSSLSVSSRRGFGSLTSTALRCPFAIAKSVLPSVLTMSGSSTPSSWTFVPEKSTPCLGGAAPARAVSAIPIGEPRPYGPTKRLAFDFA